MIFRVGVEPCPVPCYNRPMSTEGAHWREIKATVPAEDEARAAAFLIEQGAGGVWVESNGALVHLHVFFPVQEEGRVAAIRKGLRRLVSKGKVALLTALRPEEAWQTAWQKHSVPVQRIGKRLLIGATWHFPLANRSGREVIRLTPGMAFGTGTHATTKSCLILLEKRIGEEERGRLLDIGTGSGILAIAGAKLGAIGVTAVEVDPVALAVARGNARINGVASKIVFRETLPSRSRYWWVVANVTAPVLIELSEAVTDRVGPGGTLILSGILASEWRGVLLRYRERFTLVRRIQRGEWITLLLEKRKK